MTENTFIMSPSVEEDNYFFFYSKKPTGPVRPQGLSFCIVNDIWISHPSVMLGHCCFSGSSPTDLSTYELSVDNCCDMAGVGYNN